ncbi:uncharacterized protein LOC122536392 isoform X2 [Frieseomelitta varia]|uniref:uncharacterized protein LOC122536392 isoform X2 n=1 Tax=Frieseomelitta varia TaxID=561572 RepID=UPI001CB6A66D|nr:uncharacterized protein LOC122536392 isoform X2 [Frieseomelitta varia]
MLVAINYYTATVFVVLIQRSLSAMVLPRPPSSPNYIQHHDRKGNEQNFYEGKSLQNFLQNSGIERANTNDYSLVEIELQSPDEMDATNLQNIIHAMLKQSEQVRNESYPNPEVIPRSVFGVRDVGVSPSFKANTVDEDRHVLIGPSKFQAVDEKLYYLKNNRPKVYVNLRGHSGSFRKDAISKTTSSNDFIEFLRATHPLQKQTDWKFHHDKINAKHDLSTTENSIVTSSELPKQIPPPPSKFPNKILMTQTTPVQRYALKRTNILPRYRFSNV